MQRRTALTLLAVVALFIVITVEMVPSVLALLTCKETVPSTGIIGACIFPIFSAFGC